MTDVREGLSLRLHAFEPASRANGPGVRAVLWTQGCTLGCPGCFNPETHDAGSGELVSIEALFEDLASLGNSIEGITLSGGEPLQQRDALLPLLERIRSETPLSVLLFTGYRSEELGRMGLASALRACVDVAVAGRFVQSQSGGAGLCSSANQTVHFWSDRYEAADLEAVPVAEVIIDAQGDVVVSGVDPVRMGATHGV